MIDYKNISKQAAKSFLLFSLLCGVLYTGAVTAVAQMAFPFEANGSIIQIDDKKYGSQLMGQRFTSPKHMWGRITKLDVATFQNKEGEALLYAAPSNLSPASDDYAKLVTERVAKIQKAHPERAGIPIPVDLVTNSGSGLDPHISLAAARYQVPRLAKNNDLTEAQVNRIIDRCTDKKLLGVFGEDVVNVLKVNLMLDGILK